NSTVDDASPSLDSAITGLLRVTRRLVDSGNQSASTGIITNGSTPPTIKIAGQPKACTSRLASNPPNVKPVGTPNDIRITRRPCLIGLAKSEASAIQSGMPPPRPNPVSKRKPES